MNREGILVHRIAYVAHCFLTQAEFIKQQHSQFYTKYLHLLIEISMHLYTVLLLFEKYSQLLSIYTRSIETSIVHLSALTVTRNDKHFR